MKLSRKEATVVHAALQHWQQNGLLPDAQATALAATIEVQSFDWHKLAQYSFWVALTSIVISVSAALSSSWIRGLFELLVEAPPLVRSLFFALAAAGLFRFGLFKRTQAPEKIYRNEAIFFLGVLAIAGAVSQLGLAFDTDSGHFSVLLLLTSAIYAALGVVLESNLIWVFALLSLGSWMGTETGYQSGWGAYYLGMNYPLRFTLFGGLLTAGALSVHQHPRWARFSRSTLVVGLLYLFISLWILSIFGNLDIVVWRHVKQIELFHWSLLFGAAAGGAIYHGLRYADGTTKGFGITFLGINLYTRFFELFWDGLDKAIFFGLLAASFWYIGSRAETIWNLGRANELRTPPHT